jgi:hypothetical protein
MRGTVSPIGRWGFATGAILLISAVPLLAADKLPKDGAWARYYVYAKSSNGRENVSRLTISMVGTVVEGGRKLRWIEVSETYQPERPEKPREKKYTSVLKLLVPERALLESDAPLKQLVRGWRWDNFSHRADKVDTGKRDLQHFEALYRPYVLFFPGPLKQAKPTRNNRDVDHQTGRLHIAGGLAGHNVARWHAFTVPEQRSMTVDVELWLHKDVPLRMASAKLKRTYRFKKDGSKQPAKVRVVSDVEFTVEAWGTGAKSALPDAK